MTTLGLIAGNGVFPLEVARMARRQGMRTIAVAHLHETEHAAMAGGISRTRLQIAFSPDRRALMMLARLNRFSDDAVLRGVAAELESEGIQIVDPVPMLNDILAPAGLLAGPEPTAAQMNDLRLAFAIARALGAFDVGQAVAVRDGVVAAVEAAEGTDAALRRGALVCGDRLVVAKAAKPAQDLRFDRPAIGPATIDLLDELQAAVIGVEAGTAMLLEREATLDRARACNITVYGYG
jgi:UDP-2,3-diacylglucosamine hydrolase